jgi:hypothetical protein
VAEPSLRHTQVLSAVVEPLLGFHAGAVPPLVQLVTPPLSAS